MSPARRATPRCRPLRSMRETGLGIPRGGSRAEPGRRMAERLKGKFLTVIWGARYIDEFARISLPSYLAEGNLPALAAGAALSFAATSVWRDRMAANSVAKDSIRAAKRARSVFSLL